MRTLILILLCSNFLFAQDNLPESLVVRSVSAKTTDKSIPYELRNHYVYFNPKVEQKQLLLVHFVGTFDNPANTTFLPKQAADLGFKVIVLNYFNGKSAATCCENNSDSLCFENYREEMLNGKDLSPHIDISSSISIDNRLLKLVRYLSKKHPNENWDHFLKDKKTIQWDKIVASGHAEGGGHAAYIAKKHPLYRVLLFASASDFSTYHNKTANWVMQKGVTPSSKFFTYDNEFNEITSIKGHPLNLNALEFKEFDDPVTVLKVN